MRLKVTEVLGADTDEVSVHGTLIYDEGVPLLYRASKDIIPFNAVWRYGDNLRSLLEFKFSSETKVLYGVTLTLLDVLTDCSSPPMDVEWAEARHGLPVVDDLTQASDTLANPTPFATYLHGDDLYVRVASVAGRTRPVLAGPLAFLLSEGELVGFVCRGLPDDVGQQIVEMARVREPAEAKPMV
jgi:hypothetical protein